MLAKRILLAIYRLPAMLLVLLVRFYQMFISPWLGPNCRFTPTCSEYFIQSVRKRGRLSGRCAASGVFASAIPFTRVGMTRLKLKVCKGLLALRQ